MGIWDGKVLIRSLGVLEVGKGTQVEKVKKPSNSLMEVLRGLEEIAKGGLRSSLKRIVPTF